MCDTTHSHVRDMCKSMCDMTHSHVWHYLLTCLCVTWLIHMSETCVDQCVTWLIHKCYITQWHVYVWHDLFTCVTCHSYAWHVTHDMSCIWMTHVKHTKLVMGWLSFVGSFEIQVSFAKEPYKRDLYSAMRPMFLRSLPIVATPYHSRTCVSHEQCNTHQWVMSHLLTSHVTHVHDSYETHAI